MGRKKISILLAAVLLSCTLQTSRVYALGDNSEMNESYVYTPYYEAVCSPAAHICGGVVGGAELGLEGPIAPVDIFARNGRLYVVCSATNAIYILDEEYRLTDTIREVGGSLTGPNTLNAPEGIFVGEDDTIYIADTQNQRILHIDQAGSVISEFSDPQIKVMGETATFFPSKLVVDQADRIYVVGKNINRGIIELSNDGSFSSFIGAPKVKADISDILQRMFKTDAQLERMNKFIPTEYNNICIDSSGFIFGTIGSVDATAIARAAEDEPDETPDNAKTVVKLSPGGEDILLRRGNVPVIGELNFYEGDHSYIVDVAVREDGGFSILDQRHGRVFTYDMYGNLLYVFGSQGKQYGRFSTPSSLCYFGEDIVVADQISGKINIFHRTAYGEMLDEAVQLDFAGKYDQAAVLWQSLARKNSNLFLAYSGIGKMYYRDKDYRNAMKYFEAAHDYYNYDKAMEKIRKETMANALPYLFLAIAILVAVYIGKNVIKFWKRGEPACGRKGEKKKV